MAKLRRDDPDLFLTDDDLWSRVLYRARDQKRVATKRHQRIPLCFLRLFVAKYIHEEIGYRGSSSARRPCPAVAGRAHDKAWHRDNGDDCSPLRHLGFPLT